MPKPTNFWQAIRASHKRHHQTPTITPMPRNGPIPLTWEQARLWAVDQLNPDSAVHNLRSLFRLAGSLDVTALTQTLQTIINRHEALRTTIVVVNGKPSQQIAPAMPVSLPVVTLSEADQETALKRLAAEFAQQPFDLAAGPLMRLKLLRLSETEHVLLRTIHHIISDRWSDSVFMRELAKLYQAFAAGQESPLPPLPLQYADYALFQRQQSTPESQRAYWQKQLAGNSQPAILPTSANPNGSVYHGETLYIELSPALVAELKALSQQAGVSLFVVILAAFKTLLYQYSGQEDIIVCSPVAGRYQTDLKKLIGYFSKLMVVRTSLAEAPTFQELLQRVSQVTLNLVDHQDIPLQQVAEMGQLPSTVLSRVMVALQNVPSIPTTMGPITITPLVMDDGISNFDLSLSMRLQGATLIGVLRYKTALFTNDTMARFAENFQTLLQTITTNPAIRLTDLPRFTLPGQPTAQVEVPYIPPQTALEQTVSEVWQTVLQLEQISTQANFFDVGGRSLAMMQIATQLQETLQRTIPLVELFKRPTIKEMAAYLDQDSLTPTMNTRQIRDRTQQQREALKRRRQQHKKHTK